jgi:CBS domain-containing protein
MYVDRLIENQQICCARVGQTVQEVVEEMARNEIGAVPVLEGDRLVGIFSERDLLTRVVSRRLDPTKVPVEEAMTREVIAAPVHCSVAECLALIQKFRMRHLPIVDGHTLKGFISVRDLLNSEIENKEYQIRVLHEYIHYVPPYSVES